MYIGVTSKERDTALEILRQCDPTNLLALKESMEDPHFKAVFTIEEQKDDKGKVVGNVITVNDEFILIILSVYLKYAPIITDSVKAIIRTYRLFQSEGSKLVQDFFDRKIKPAEKEPVRPKDDFKF